MQKSDAILLSAIVRSVAACRPPRASPVFEYFAVNAADSFANRIYFERRQKEFTRFHQLRDVPTFFLPFSIFPFFFFISSLFFEYTAKRNDETTRCAQFRHVLIDQFQYSNSDEPPQYLTFNPFAEKNCYRWIDCGVYECTTIKQFFVNFERRVRILLEKNFFFYRRLLFKTFQVKYL